MLKKFKILKKISENLRFIDIIKFRRNIAICKSVGRLRAWSMLVAVTFVLIILCFLLVPILSNIMAFKNVLQQLLNIFSGSFSSAQKEEK